MGNKKWDTRYKTESLILHTYFFILLFVMVSRYKSIEGLADLLIYGSTLILVLHIWWGAYFIIRHPKTDDSFLLFFMNLIMLTVLFFTPFIIRNKELWAVLFSLFFALAILEYSVLHDKTSRNDVKMYIRKKIYYEMLVPLFFLLAYIFFRFFKSESLFLILCLTIFTGQIFFAVFLFRIKKVYKIIKS